jgi:hypothetical protein
MSDQYTSVQHSGFGYKPRKAEFSRGLEVRTVGTKREQDLVLAAGGILFDSWKAADEFCDRAMYPGEREGLDLIPRAQGSFSDTTIDDLRVYIPTKEVQL